MCLTTPRTLRPNSVRLEFVVAREAVRRQPARSAARHLPQAHVAFGPGAAALAPHLPAEPVLDAQGDRVGKAAKVALLDYQRAFALTYLGYNWLRMSAALEGEADEVFKASKLCTARFFASKLLPQVGPLCATVQGGAEDFMALPATSL